MKLSFRYSPVLFLKREKTAGQALWTVSPATARGQQATASQKGQQPLRRRFGGNKRGIRRTKGSGHRKERDQSEASITNSWILMQSFPGGLITCDFLFALIKRERSPCFIKELEFHQDPSLNTNIAPRSVPAPNRSVSGIFQSSRAPHAESQ